MRNQLPPLHEIRAFEAVARHGSFHRAAGELHVTPSAVSHQVRSLEQFLGVSLFKRLNRQIVLTKEGTAYLPPIRLAIAQIRSATKQVVTNVDHGPIVMCVEPMFAQNWLIQRLVRFHNRYPEVELHVMSSGAISDLFHSDIDLAIAYGPGCWPGLQVHKLMHETLVLACSPAFLDGPGGLKHPQDLHHVTLLHVVSQTDQWQLWLRAAGVEGIDVERGPKFHDILFVVEAAIAGLGVAVVDRHLITKALARGHLVTPFEVAVSSGGGHYLLYPEDYADRANITAFRDWLLAEIALHEQDRTDVAWCQKAGSLHGDRGGISN